VDINPERSADGVLKSEYTLDGIHFDGRAYEIWTSNLVRVVFELISASGGSKLDNSFQSDPFCAKISVVNVAGFPLIVKSAFSALNQKRAGSSHGGHGSRLLIRRN
jgi:hypothetical protein